jgi:hypothetical protein
MNSLTLLGLIILWSAVQVRCSTSIVDPVMKRRARIIDARAGIHRTPHESSSWVKHLLLALVLAPFERNPVAARVLQIGPEAVAWDLPYGYFRTWAGKKVILVSEI